MGKSEKIYKIYQDLLHFWRPSGTSSDGGLTILIWKKLLKSDVGKKVTPTFLTPLVLATIRQADHLAHQVS